jgi:RHH-type proline utilization regulon transcriptional repressor/proline dehydrogenase/delta 1-pyrroline-5-carboxylate dehydrogenase
MSQGARESSGVASPVYGADEWRVEQAVATTRRLVDEAADLDARSGRRERLRRRRLHVLVNDPAASEFTVQLTDEVTRIADSARAARRFAELVGEADLAAFSTTDRWLLAAGARLARFAPRLVMPLVIRRLRSESEGVILSAEDPDFARHIAGRRSQGIHCNVNVLGEAIVGDREARRRLDMVLARLRRPDVDYVSVKISAACADINPFAFDDTVERVAERLRELYGLAASFEPSKFVNLDMEEYRDLGLTVAAFQRVLDEPAFERLDAGIVLQAYLPDARGAARDVADWAVRRHRRAGGHTKIRIVKGANLAMETVEAELRGWVPAPYPTKADVDANYKAVLDVLCEPEFDTAVGIGVASHNLFDVAWALVLSGEMVEVGRPDRIEIEMLEGMSPSQSDVVRAAAGGVLLYAPVVRRSDFASAIAYLVRRLDENTSPDNFLSHLFDLATDRSLFATEEARFRESVRRRHDVDGRPRRSQDRSFTPESVGLELPFENAADTDWTRPGNRAWMMDALGSNGVADPVVGSSQITFETIDESVSTGVAARPVWSEIGVRGRAEIINRVGDVFEATRGRVLATMIEDAGKTVLEGDPEVSEAIDFARYYARESLRLASLPGGSPLGTVVVTPPWNFPFAIPAGGVLAALAAGNTVILKPAPQTMRTAALIAELCWEAGVPRNVLQFAPVPDGKVGQRLVTHPDVDAVILTGAHDTAAMFHSWRPGLRLHAETSGKNAIVITATADLDHAVFDLVRSAFGHAGQKCSAASLAVVEASLYDDPAFLERIRDASATLCVGAADDPTTDVGPLIDPPGDSLQRALSTLEPGESWLLTPRCLADDGRLWSPGVRIGVRPGSWFAQTECFGPVLGIIRADDLEHAVAIQNSTDFGLTAGLQALDPGEIERWLDRVEAGNLYVNRGITGAIVQRQPFGGWKRSAVGPTAKAGGPNYVASLARWVDAGEATVAEVAETFVEWMSVVGSAEVDPTGLVAERNVFRYRTLIGGVAVRFGSGTTERERDLVSLAAETTGCRVIISEEVDESTEELAMRIGTLGIDRVRLLAHDDAGFVLRRACHAVGVAIDDAAVIGMPEIELPRWLHEQAVSITMHRHGRVARQALLEPG